MIGVYEEPPPAGQDEIRSFTLEQESFSGWDSVVQRQVIRGLVGATRFKDFLHELFL